MRVSSLLVCLALVPAASAVAQSWSIRPNVQPTAFTSLVRLTHDSTGPIAYDEFSSTSRFDPSSNAWVTVPSAQEPFFAALIGNGTGVYRFGGIDQASGAMIDGVRRFSRVTNTWNSMTSSGQLPTPRIYAAGVSISPNNFLVVGGTTDGSQPASGALSYMFTRTSPTAVSCAPLTTGPSLRFKACMGAGAGGTAVLFGGNDGTNVLGDTWVFGSGGFWTAVGGNMPPPAEACDLAFDAQRGITLLAHPNGQTWEFNGTSWRRVFTNAAPFVAGSGSGIGGILGLQLNGFGTYDTMDFTPSVAAYSTTLANTACFAGGAQPFHLAAQNLPLLGTTFQLRVSETSSTALLVGAAEFGAGTNTLAGCNCRAGVLLNGAQIFLVNQGGFADWQMPIPANLGLIGLSMQVQAFAFGENPCQLAMSDRGTVVVGG